MKNIREISGSRGVNGTETEAGNFCTRYELGQVASVADCLLVRYVHSGVHELQFFMHSAI